MPRRLPEDLDEKYLSNGRFVSYKGVHKELIINVMKTDKNLGSGHRNSNLNYSQVTYLRLSIDYPVYKV